MEQRQIFGNYTLDYAIQCDFAGKVRNSADCDRCKLMQHHAENAKSSGEQENCDSALKRCLCWEVTFSNLCAVLKFLQFSPLKTSYLVLKLRY